MADLVDLEVLVKSKVPLILVESHEENRALDLFKRLGFRVGMPVQMWTVTEGLQRLDLRLEAAGDSSDPSEALKSIKASTQSCIYVLVDFHPYLEEAINVRLLKEIAQAHFKNGHLVILLSPTLTVPDELSKFSTFFELSYPTRDQLIEIVKEEAFIWSNQNQKQKVKTDSKTLERLVQNLTGVTASDAKRLARKVISDDGAISASDLPEVMKAKYELLNKDGLLSYEYETEQFAYVGGMQKLKRWLDVRQPMFHSEQPMAGLAPPKGVLLLGVQGCGKSLVAKAVAGVFSVPLLRLDFGTLYNKFFGESEKNLRDALKTAGIMAPCVLWIDEIEKGISTGDSDGGTSRRVLGSLLTWMAENKLKVFIVATANDIETLPPELIRKGRFDEIFFVDLPKAPSRYQIFKIHIEKRKLAPQKFDLERLSAETEGFSGAEIEQAIVSALYGVYASGAELTTEAILQEIANTRPLSVVMADPIARLREWAQSRTVAVD